MGIRVLHVDRDYVEIPLLEGGVKAKAVAWPGTNGYLGVMHYVAYEAGQASVPHAHPYSQDVFYIIEGSGSMVDTTDGRNEETPIEPGSVVIVDPGTIHQVRADTRLINVGGPSPADIAFYKNFGLEW
jgi:mannose-6-phosphate isomerase-like protein (cupin superfamily)